MTNLTITEEQFNNIYPDLKGQYGKFNNPPPAGISDKEFEEQYLKSKLWRLNNLYYVINKDGKLVKFRMNLAQHKVYGASRQHPRVIILKSRQQGISTFWLIAYFDDAIFAPFLNIGMMAQGKAEAGTLLERTKLLWEMLPQAVKDFVGVRLLKDNANEYSFSNKSTIFIRVSFRSTTLQRLHVSEMGKIANQAPGRAKEVKTGTLQALGRGNTGVIESTAEGDNMFKEMWDQAEVAFYSGQMSEKDFNPVFLSWVDDPDCNESVDQAIDEEAAKYFTELEAKLSKKEGRPVALTRQQKNFWVVQRRELGAELFQEYPATPEEAFMAIRDGTYWNRQFQELVVRRERVIPGLYDENLPVDVYLDIGVEDYCVMGFKQWYRGEYRIIDEYWNQGYDLAHYMDEAMSRGYNIRSIRFPHDISVREYSGGNSGQGGLARTRLDIAREKVRKEGWNVQLAVVTKCAITDGIEGVRRIMPNLFIDPKCKYLIQCFQKYTREYDEKLQAWKSTEVHDEYSHGAAMLRYLSTDSIESESYHRSRAERDAGRRRGRGRGAAL